MDRVGIYLVLGWRNLWLHPLRTLLTTAALAIGIAALVFLSAMDDGWMQQIKTNFALTLTGHIQVHADGFEDNRKLEYHMDDPDALIQRINSADGLQQVVKRVRLSGLASSAGANAGALVVGVEPKGERLMSRLAGFISDGSWFRDGDAKAAVVGDGLASRLGIGMGDKLVLMAAVSGGDIASEVFRVRGMVHSGVMDVDNMLVLVPLTTAQQWLGLGHAVTDLVIRADSFEQVTPLANQLKQRLAGSDQPLEVLRWFDIDPMAQQWADFADAYTWIVLAVVIMIVLAEVLNTMLMSMHERVREFGLMSALGVSSAQIFTMMVCETLILVMLGGLAGLLIGGGLSLWFGDQGIDLSQYAIAFSFMYMDPVIHPLLQTDSVLRIMMASLFGALIAGLIPAWKASRLEPAHALRD